MIAKQIQRCPAQPLQPCQNMKRPHHPWTELTLFRAARGRVGGFHDRRGEVERYFILPIKLRPHGFDKIAIGIKPCNFIFIFISEQLVIIPRRRRVKVGPDSKTINSRAIPFGIGRILIGSQIINTLGDHSIDSVGNPLLRHRAAGGGDQRIEPGWVVRGKAAIGKSLTVIVNADTIQGNCLINGIESERNQPTLPSIAHHKNVRAHFITEQRAGGKGRIDKILGPCDRNQFSANIIILEINIFIQDEGGHRRIVDIGDRDSAFGIQCFMRSLPHRRHHVTRQQQIRRTRHNMTDMQIVEVGGKPHMAKHLPTLLRQAR